MFENRPLASETKISREPSPQSLDEFKEAARQVEGLFLHAVMMRFKETAGDSEIAQAVEELRSLGELPGVVALMVREESIDQRKGHTLLELGVFESGQAFLDWRDHPKHRDFAERASRIADWITSDSEVDNHVLSVVQHLGSVSLGSARVQRPDTNN